ncbi:MAG: YlbF family regulator [Brevibacillus sp.]|nr:YlbF family regulator [Brevibacillus sp.]
MNYDKAYELARAIRESDEFRAYTSQKAKVENNPDARRMLEDFRKRQVDLEMRRLKGETISQEEMGQLQRLYETISLHDDIRQLFACEQRLILMMQDVQRIIAEPFEGLFGSQQT